MTLSSVALPDMGIAFMDRDHREELRLLEQVASALWAAAHGADRARVLPAWQALVRFAGEHFAREEEAMARLAYARIAVHAAEHRLVLAAMEEEAAALAQTGDVERLQGYVEQGFSAWLTQHVETSDAIAARYLLENGVR